MNENEFLTVAEVARRLKVGTSSVYALVQRGKIDAHHVGPGGGAIRISEAELAAFLAKTLTGPETHEVEVPRLAVRGKSLTQKMDEFRAMMKGGR